MGRTMPLNWMIATDGLAVGAGLWETGAFTATELFDRREPGIGISLFVLFPRFTFAKSRIGQHSHAFGNTPGARRFCQGVPNIIGSLP